MEQFLYVCDIIKRRSIGMILINFQVIYIIKQRDGGNFTDTRGIAKVEVFLMVRFLQSGLRPIPK